MDHEKLVRVYLKMKARKAELKAEANAITEQMEQIQGILLQSLRANKVTSMATAIGTFFVRKDIKVSCSDWPAYRKWMIENDALDGVEKRVTKSFIQDYREQNDDDVPPGINALDEYVIGIRSKP